MTGFRDLWNKERLAVVNGVGYPQPNYSHFRATEIYYTAEPDKTPSYGWLGRAIDAKKSEKPLRAIALSKQKPLSLAAGSPGIVTMTDFRQFKLPGDMAETVKMYERFKDLGGAREEVSRRALEAIKVARRIAALTPVRQGFYGRLGNDLAKVVALLRTNLDLEVIHLSFGGFDTHANQAGAAQRPAQPRSATTCATSRTRSTGSASATASSRASSASSAGARTRTSRAAPTTARRTPPSSSARASSRACTAATRRSRTSTTTTSSTRPTSAASTATLLKQFLHVDPKPVLGDHKPLELMA